MFASCIGRLRALHGWAWAAAGFAAVLCFLVLFPATAGAAPGDVGFEGPVYGTGPSSIPTGSKPESKLWFNDGFWWAVMFKTIGASGDYNIFKLDPATQTWSDTGVLLDGRINSRADALWDEASGKLYVASHLFDETPAFEPAPQPDNSMKLFRFSYDPSTDAYSLDAGFPKEIDNQKSETLVIDKDSTGRLWATWTQQDPLSDPLAPVFQVFVKKTTGACAAPGASASACNWSSPIDLPGTSDTGLTIDDISSAIAFGGSKIGVMWSNQTTGVMSFAVHNDGAADASWAVETAFNGDPNNADDHINLKSDASGRVFASVKTKFTSASAAGIALLVRGAGGGWSPHTVTSANLGHTRPIVVLDETNDVVHVYATGGGVIFEKTSSLSSISFPSGNGTEVMKDASSLNVNNATSTKQVVDGTSGLVVLAANDVTNTYWHSSQTLLPAPVADFTGTPTSGTTPLTVQFTDTSTGGPTSWAWDFQSDGTVDSTVQNPQFAYAAAGTYSVKLTASNAGGSDDEIKVGYVTVNAPPAPPAPTPATAPTPTTTPTTTMITSEVLSTTVVKPGACTIVGTSGDDVLRGTSDDDIICGKGGNDRILAGAGNDIVYGGAGDDAIFGGAGTDMLLGGLGKDMLNGGQGRDSLQGGGGADLLIARDGRKDVVNGGPGRNRARIDRKLDQVRAIAVLV